MMEPEKDLFGNPINAKKRPAATRPEPVCSSRLPFDPVTMVRVSPDTWCWKPSKDGKVPTYGRLRWISNADGTYRPAPQPGHFAIINRELLDELGFTNGNYSIDAATLRRLAVAEEITMFKISPKVRMIDLDSWWRYIDECIADPDKWEEDGESWRNYMHRNALDLKDVDPTDRTKKGTNR